MAEEHPQRPEEISGHDQAAATDAEHAADQSRIFDSVRQDNAELRAGFNALTERVQALEGRLETLEQHAGQGFGRAPDEDIGLP